MSVWRQVILELAYRRIATVSMTLAAMAGVGGSLVAVWLNEGAVRETKRVQRDLGFNLRVLPGDTDPDGYRLRGYSEATMGEEVVRRLAAAETLAYNHLVATLVRPLEMDGATVLVTGVADTLFPPGQRRSPMSPAIAEGEVQVGASVAHRLGWRQGDEVAIREWVFKVDRVVGETGGLDDLRVWLRLADAQDLLALPGRITEIRAIDCLCLSPEEDPQSRLRAEITSIAPETQVILLQKMATARARQRIMSSGLASRLPAVFAIAAAAALVALSLYNAKQRLGEFAVERALGAPAGRIAALVVGRVLACVAVGSAAGAAIAYVAVAQAAPTLFPVTGRAPVAPLTTIGFAGTIAFAFALAASAAPLVVALGLPIALVLRDNR